MSTTMLSAFRQFDEDSVAVHSWLNSITNDMRLISFVEMEYLRLRYWDEHDTFAVSVNKSWTLHAVPQTLQRFKTTLPSPQPTFAFGYRPSACPEHSSGLFGVVEQELAWPVVTVEVATTKQTPEETSMRCIYAGVLMLANLAALRRRAGRSPAYGQMQVFTIAMDKSLIRIIDHWIEKDNGHDKYLWKVVASWPGVMSNIEESGRIVRDLIKQALDQMLSKIKDDLSAADETRHLEADAEQPVVGRP